VTVGKELGLMVFVLVLDVASKLGLVAGHLLATVVAELVLPTRSFNG